MLQHRTKWVFLCWFAAIGCSKPEADAHKSATTDAAADDRDAGDTSSAPEPAATAFTGCVKLTKADVTPGALPTAAASDEPSRVQLQILVLSAGDDVGTSWVKAGLREGLVPCTEIDLSDPDRPTIDQALLSDVVLAHTSRAKYQAVVLPSEAPPQLSAAELDALAQFERRFQIRELASYVYPSAALGLRSPDTSGFSGSLDGRTAFATVAARAGAFAYLRGPIPFDDMDLNLAETSGYLATPLPAAEGGDPAFTPLVTMPIPGAQDSEGVVLGVYSNHGRERLVMTAAINAYQFQQQALFPGILNWLTRGVHLGSQRNFFSVHVDDIFLSNARWSTTAHCTVSSSCDPNHPEPLIRMTSDDVDHLQSWQAEHRMLIDLAFNGSGYERAVSMGAFALGEHLLELRASFRWISHTYNHLYLGCSEDFSTTPVRCKAGPSGAIQWTSYQDVYDQISRNQAFAREHDLATVDSELITGEHSGLRRAPLEPSDNPNLARGLTATGIAWVASDASRELMQRRIGSARTTPRYPMSTFFDAASKADTVDEYNYVYTAAVDGGSGACASDATSTCIAPLDRDTGFDSYIIPLEAHGMLMHVVSNSPRAHFAHQSNLAEERVLYPVLERVLADYRRTFADNADIINASMSELGSELEQQARWADSHTRVSAYIEDGRLTIELSGGDDVQTPLTLPEASGTAAAELHAYGGYRTGWATIPAAGGPVSLPVPVR